MEAAPLDFSDPDGLCQLPRSDIISSIFLDALKWSVDSVAVLRGPAIFEDFLDVIPAIPSLQSALLAAALVSGKRKVKSWWARLDSNQGPIGYEPTALPLSYEPREPNSIPPLPTPQHGSAVISYPPTPRLNP